MFLKIELRGVHGVRFFQVCASRHRLIPNPNPKDQKPRNRETLNLSMFAYSSTNTKTVRNGQKGIEEEKYISSVTCHASYVTCYMSCVMYHVLRVPCHLSITLHIAFSQFAS